MQDVLKRVEFLNSWECGCLGIVVVIDLDITAGVVTLRRLQARTGRSRRRSGSMARGAACLADMFAIDNGRPADWELTFLSTHTPVICIFKANQKGDLVKSWVSPKRKDRYFRPGTLASTR